MKLFSPIRYLMRGENNNWGMTISSQSKRQRHRPLRLRVVVFAICICSRTCSYAPRNVVTMRYKASPDLEKVVSASRLNKNSMASKQYPSEVNVLRKRVSQIRVGCQPISGGRVNFFRMDRQMLRIKGWKEKAHESKNDSAFVAGSREPILAPH